MDIFNELKKTLNNSYSPYSKFRVSAIIVTKNNDIIKGCNVENISYGLTMCAERVALGNMYANGYDKNDVSFMAILSDSDDFIKPCGACRQVMIELLNDNTVIYLYNSKGEKIENVVSNLLPNSFRSF